MPSPPDLRDTILNSICDAWKTKNRVTIFLVEHLPAELWDAAIPGAPRRTIRMIAGHIHNARTLRILTSIRGARVPSFPVFLTPPVALRWD